MWANNFDNHEARYHTPRTTTRLQSSKAQDLPAWCARALAHVLRPEIYQREITEAFKPVRRLQSVSY